MRCLSDLGWWFTNPHSRLASLLCAVAYTAGPFPLAYLGLGDLFVLLFFGFGAVGGTTWLLCHEQLPWMTWL